MAALLAFDTASERIAVAAGRNGDWRHAEGEGGARASRVLLPMIRGVLAEAGLALADLDAIAFGRGPGAFTGIRTACSVAQGLAFGLDKPVLAIDSLLAVAEDARRGRERFRVWATIDARMDEIYAAEYEHGSSGLRQGDGDGNGHGNSGDGGGRWRITAEPTLIGPASLDARWSLDPPHAVAGDALTLFADRLPAIGTAERCPDARASAKALQTLAEYAWRDGAGVDAALALPIYLRDKVAQTTTEREAARAAAAKA